MPIKINQSKARRNSEEMNTYRIPFGNLEIGPVAREYINQALDRNWISEGSNVRLFEERFAEKFGWRHAIMTSSGTMAGQVVWMAIRELTREKWGDAEVVTPACAFVATASCILAAGLKLRFADVDMTLNLDPTKLEDAQSVYGAMGCQFVMNMGRSVNLRCAEQLPSWKFYVVDACEGHGGTYSGMQTAKYCGADAAIFSLYTAHLIISGEGGVICTDRDDIADLCRSIKSHGRPVGSNYFDFQRIGTNAKANELTAAIGLEGLERFDEAFEKRRIIRKKLLERLSEFPLILFPDAEGEVIAPHAFPILLADENGDIGPLYNHLEKNGIECKTLWGALSNHKAFRWMGIPEGTFPVAERIGRTGLHFSCGDFITDDDIDYIGRTIGGYFHG